MQKLSFNIRCWVALAIVWQMMQEHNRSDTEEQFFVTTYMVSKPMKCSPQYIHKIFKEMIKVDWLRRVKIESRTGQPGIGYVLTEQGINTHDDTPFIIIPYVDRFLRWKREQVGLLTCLS